MTGNSRSIIRTLGSLLGGARILALATSTAALAACADATTQPEPGALRVRKDVTCVQYNGNGEIIASQAPNEHGGCADGFELKIWV